MKNKLKNATVAALTEIYTHRHADRNTPIDCMICPLLRYSNETDNTNTE